MNKNVIKTQFQSLRMKIPLFGSRNNDSFNNLQTLLFSVDFANMLKTLLLLKLLRKASRLHLKDNSEVTR